MYFGKAISRKLESLILRYDAMFLGEWFRTSKEGSALVLKGQEVLNMKVDLFISR